MGLSSRASEWYVRFVHGFAPVPADEQHLSAYLHDVKTFMQALLICANGDGKITSAERDWVTGFCSAMGGSEAMVREIAAYPADEDIELVVNRGHRVNRARHSVVYNAIRACSADGELHAGEVATIKKMAAALGVTEQAVEDLRALYDDEEKLKARRQELIYPGGSPY